MFGDPRTTTTDTREFVDLSFAVGAATATRVSGRVAVDNYQYDGSYAYQSNGDESADTLVNRDLAIGSWLTGEVQAATAAGRLHRIVAGLEFRDNFRQDQTNFDQVVYLDAKDSSRVLGVFLQDEWRLRRPLSVVLGVRFDHRSDGVESASPRLALVWTPDSRTSAKLLHGRAFRAPNAWETAYALPEIGTSSGYLLDGALRSETIRTNEVVLERELPRALGGDIHTSASLYHYTLNNLLEVREAGDYFLTVNSGSARTAGLELELRGRWPGGITGRASYTTQSSTMADHTQPPNSPSTVGVVQAHLPLAGDRLGLGTQVTFVGERFSVRRSRVPGAAVANLVLDARLGGLSFFGGAFNLLDRAVFDPVGAHHAQNSIQQNGRTFRVGFGYRF